MGIYDYAVKRFMLDWEFFIGRGWVLFILLLLILFVWFYFQNKH